MVVAYPSGTEGSFFSFFTVTPKILFKWTGSVVPYILPQLSISVGICILVKHLDDANDLNDLGDMNSKGFDVIGVLLAFLMVFKTQTAYSQFWQASDNVDGLLQTSRSLAMTVVTGFVKNPEADQEARRVVRLLTLHYFMIIEVFQRTGENSVRDSKTKDKLRSDIRYLCGENEYQKLYPDEPDMPIGSCSKHRCANPTEVIFWIHMCIGKAFHAGFCQAPVFAVLQGCCGDLSNHFWALNKIDKTQFPLPYAQIVKILIIFFVYSLPFRMVMDVEDASLSAMITVTFFVSMGFFGLDEVAEILESPLGTDPNDIQLRKYGRRLLKDLSMIY